MILSIIIPVLNEKESIKILYDSLINVIAENYHQDDYEILFIDDGSKDGSVDQIKQIVIIDERVKIIEFRRNMGKSAALQAGFRNATGDIVITMDADLQDDPEEIPKFINKINEGYDCVSGWKYNRLDPIEKKITIKIIQ